MSGAIWCTAWITMRDGPSRYVTSGPCRSGSTCSPEAPVNANFGARILFGRQSMEISRRQFGLVGAGAGLMAGASAAATSDGDRERRMQWWHEARFGMFIHWAVQ